MAVGFCLLMALLLTNPLQEGIAGLREGPEAQFDPGLVDINDVDIVVEIRGQPSPDPNGSEFSAHLERLIHTRLETSGIRVFDHTADAKARATQRIVGRRLNVDPNTLRWRPAAVPILRAAVDIVSLGKDMPVTLYAHTSFARLVCLDGQTAPSLRATVWNADPVAESVRSSQWRDEVQKAVLGQVGAFIAARRAAASHDSRPQRSLSVPSSPGSAASESPYPFVASKTGFILHRPGCRWAQYITGDNRIGYRTRDEAMQAGKRPCKTCSP